MMNHIKHALMIVPRYALPVAILGAWWSGLAILISGSWWGLCPLAGAAVALVGWLRE